MEKAVVITGLTKQYGNGRGIQDINLSIDQGEIVGILGPNGAGKTTLLKCMTGLTSPDQGSVELFGADLQSNCQASFYETRNQSLEDVYIKKVEEACR